MNKKNTSILKSIGIIPARYASTRFPGKPLALIGNKPMIVRVYEQAQKSMLSKVIVATDNQQIRSTIESAGGEVIMTPANLQSGTDRCFDAYEKLNEIFDILINIQGDEPFINPENIDLLLMKLAKSPASIGSLYTPFSEMSEVISSNRVKVTTDINGLALSFSRSVMPFNKIKLKPEDYKKHLGVYGFKTNVINQLKSLKPSFLELAESLEQLRWLENGFDIVLAYCEEQGIAIDTPQDLKKAEEYYKKLTH